MYQRSIRFSLLPPGSSQFGRVKAQYAACRQSSPVKEAISVAANAGKPGNSLIESLSRRPLAARLSSTTFYRPSLRDETIKRFSLSGGHFTMPDEFADLETYLRRVPSIGNSMEGCTFGKGRFDNGNWYVKFSIDIEHPLAWNVVQEFGNVLNYLSITERLPTVFMPVSPPSYLNGGPREFLAWVIESTATDFAPKTCMEWLEGRLPQPVEDLSQWQSPTEDTDA